MTVLASNFSDPVHARIIDRAVLGLVALAVVVLVATVVWWRATRSEHPALAPLEVMGKRRFRQADHYTRAEVLEAVRPGPVQGDDDLIVADGESEVAVDGDDAVEPVAEAAASEASAEGGTQAGTDVSSDASPDASTQAGTDASLDASTDASTQAGAVATPADDVLSEFADLLPERHDELPDDPAEREVP